MHNHLWFGDNLDILQREVPDLSVDLVYLDPPFNSKAHYNVLYETPDNERETAQQTAFRDSWTWGDEAEFCFERVLAAGGQVAAIINALTVALQRSDTMAYLVMMAARLIEIHRVLRNTGSLYLHCDSTASHYLKVVLDSVFGAQNFRNEIVWKRTSAHNDGKRCGRIHDTLLFYSKSDVYTWNDTYQPYDPDYVETYYRYEDPDGRRFMSGDLAGAGQGPTRKFDDKVIPPPPGRHWAYDQAGIDRLLKENRIFWTKNGVPRLKKYLDEMPGMVAQDIWADKGVQPIVSWTTEGLGYPTQKSVALLKRVISASSNEGDVVLDPFCGCGTTVHAAQELKRQWIGIDVSYYAVRLIERRLKKEFGQSFDVPISGIPKDLASAEALADRDPYGFQQWIVGELGCQLWNDGKKGRDTGIDGEMWFMSGPGKAAGRLLVQVKGGKRATSAEVRDFAHVLEREKADMGIFVCRNEPTPDMQRTASSTGNYHIGSFVTPRMQLFMLSAWFAGQRPRLPVPVPLVVPQDKSAARRIKARAKRPDPRQPQFTFAVEGGLAKAKKGQIINPAALPDDAIRADGTR